MKTLIRTIVVTVTAVAAIGIVGPLPDAAVAAPGPVYTASQPQSWWCRLTHLC